MNPVEYHVVIHALEAPNWNTTQRFVATVENTLCGLLPYSRFLSAGHKRSGDTNDGKIESRVTDLLRTDLNPAALIIGNLTNPHNAVWALNAYTHSIPVGVRTSLEWIKTPKSFKLDMNRDLIASDEDPHACSISAFAIMNSIVKSVQHNTHRSLAPNLYSVACYLGIENSATAELAQIFSWGEIPLDATAKLLGCNRRTLERSLQKDGLTPDTLRRASRLIRATQRLHTDDSLTTIAAEEGFSDLAHMSRCFRDSCGVAPSILRIAAQGGLTPEPLYTNSRYIKVFQQTSI